jgi:hypothetical protein
VLAPRGYFLGLYVLEVGAILGALWFWVSHRKSANKALQATAAAPGS